MNTKELHEQWLKHPVTQDAIKLLKARYDLHKSALQEGILAYSNVEAETKQRVAMNTCEALGLVLFKTESFVQQLNKLNKE